jgi:hypothetical protein
VHVITDGVVPLDVPGALVHSVYEPADNVGLTAFEARPLVRDPTRYEALIQVVNASTRGQRVRLLIRGSAAFSIVQDLDLEAGEAVNATFDVSEFEGGVLAASAIGVSDAFPLDDVAYAVIPPHHAKRVLLVSAGNALLADALRSLPGVHLTIVPPPRYADATHYDAIVFDRFAPDAPPPAGALLLRPPPRDWLASTGTARGLTRITTWDREHPVSGAIDWSGVRLAKARLDAPPPHATPLVLAGESAANAVATAGKARARWIKTGFALADSNFALQPDFPVFLGGAIGWLSAPDPVLVTGLGRAVEVPLPQAQVEDSSGRPVSATASDHGVVFEAPGPDVYTVRNADAEVLVVANVPDPGAARINRTRLPAGSGVATADQPGWLRRTELWVALLLCAFALLLVDWTVIAGRVAP